MLTTNNKDLRNSKTFRFKNATIKYAVIINAVHLPYLFDCNTIPFFSFMINPPTSMSTSLQIISSKNNNEI